MLQKIQNPSHKHILTYTDEESVYRVYICNVCREKGEGGRYRCHPCSFDAHPSCARWPIQKIQNPSHEHILSYTHFERAFSCDVCAELGKGGRYRCHPCDFDAHPSCAGWPIQKIQNPSHEHILSYTHIERAFRCDVCRQLGEGGRYRCHPCDFDAHPDCARSPIQKMQNPSHEHFVSYTDGGSVYRVYTANVCGEEGEGGRYKCDPCDFDAHPWCASSPIQNPRCVTEPQQSTLVSRPIQNPSSTTEQQRSTLVKDASRAMLKGALKGFAIEALKEFMS